MAANLCQQYTDIQRPGTDSKDLLQTAGAAVRFVTDCNFL